MGTKDDLAVAVEGSRHKFTQQPRTSFANAFSDSPALAYNSLDSPTEQEYMMFVEDDDTANGPSWLNESVPPPTYQDAVVSKAQTKKSNSDIDRAPTTTSSSWPPQDLHFYKGNGLSSKARLRSTDGREFHLIASIHKSKPSTIQLYSGPSSTTCLGSVSFPATDNSFQILTSGARGSLAPADLIQVRAKIGLPHPASYTFTLPPRGCSGTGKEVIWTRTTNGYKLSDTTWNSPIASWTLVQGEKFDAKMRWHVEPRDVVEEVVVLLSFVGAMSRLRLKGRDQSGMGRNSGRWGAFWFMAVLGTAAAADV